MRSSKKYFPAFLITGLLFLICTTDSVSQTVVRGTFEDCFRCKIQIATYEGHENTVLNAVRANGEGSYALTNPSLPYNGFYKLEVENAQGEIVLSFPVWLEGMDVQVSGKTNATYIDLSFDDIYNNSYQRVLRTITPIQNRLEYLASSEGVFEGHPLEKKLKKAYDKELKALEVAYREGIKKAPSEPLKMALRLRKKIDSQLYPFPVTFSSEIFSRIDWEHPQTFHEPIVPEFISLVFRQYLYNSGKAPAEQEAFIKAFTIGIWETIPQKLPIGQSVQQLLRKGYRQIDAWDALALLDSIQGREDASKSYVEVENAKNWLATDKDGNPVSSNQFLGKKYLLVFWSPLCGFCNSMIPKYEAQKQAFLDAGIEIVGVALDPGYLPKGKINAFHHLILDAEYLEPGQQPKGITIASDFSFAATPAYFLMDEEGKLAKRYFTWDEALGDLRETD